MATRHYPTIVLTGFSIFQYCPTEQALLASLVSIQSNHLFLFCLLSILFIQKIARVSNLSFHTRAAHFSLNCEFRYGNMLEAAMSQETQL